MLRTKAQRTGYQAVDRNRLVTKQLYMISAFAFLLAAYVLSKTTPPPHHDTWEEIQSKIDNQPK